jgi:pimeloyl-ACP methyl ester carboxylesterase
LWKARENPSFLASKTPVLLVHGVCGEVDSTWNEMADALVKAGRRVYAVSFSVPCGSIEPKAQALADAIGLMKSGGVNEVDVVTHSMGGLVTRYYMQNMIDIPTRPSSGSGAYPYLNDVRDFVMLGTPNGGFDQIFRHPQFAGLVLEVKGVVPSPWTNQDVAVGSKVLFGLGGGDWISVGSGAYDGILEMTKAQPNSIDIQSIEKADWISAAQTGDPAVVYSVRLDRDDFGVQS